MFKILAIIFTFSFLLFPLISSSAGLIPCDGLDCDFCDLLQLAQNGIDFLFYKVAIPLVAVFIVIGGFYIMTAAGSTDKVKKGRDIIQSAIIGLVILFLSWIFVDILVRVIGGSSQPAGFSASWYEVGRNLNCQ